MKKSLLLIASLAILMISCDKGETAPENPSPTPVTPVEVPYKVLEEKILTVDELFESAAATLTKIAGDEADKYIKQLGDAFFAAAGKLAPEDETKSSCPPLLYKTARVNYTSVDENGDDATVSALIVYPMLRSMDKVLLINHGTHVGVFMVPTYYTAVEAVLGASGGLCILPDYLGVGGSNDRHDLYLNEELNGHFSIDALLTLMQYAEDEDLRLEDGYKTYIAGYSQGGAVSLAALRQFQRMSKEEQARFNLQRVICGDGPYDLRATFDQYVKDHEAGEKIGMGAVIANVINGMYWSYQVEMGQYNYEDYFTDWALSTGVPQAVYNNQADLFDMLFTFKGKTLGDILDMEFIAENKDAYETLLSMMDRQDLCHGWTPEYPLRFFHCNPDYVVPYVNFEKAYEGLDCACMEYPDIVEIENPSMSAALSIHIYGMVAMLARFLAGEYY